MATDAATAAAAATESIDAAAAPNGEAGTADAVVASKGDKRASFFGMYKSDKGGEEGAGESPASLAAMAVSEVTGQPPIKQLVESPEPRSPKPGGAGGGVRPAPQAAYQNPTKKLQLKRPSAVDAVRNRNPSLASPTSPKTPNSPGTPFDPQRPWFCHLCGKDFHSDEASRKHKKYSSLHAMNKAARLSKGEVVHDFMDEEEPLRDAVNLYDGSIYFWRTDEHLDVQVFEDKPDNVFIVIVFNPAQDKEYPALFFDWAKMESTLNYDSIEAPASLTKAEKFDKARNGPRKSQVKQVKELKAKQEVDAATARAEKRSKAIFDGICSRLHVAEVPGGDGEYGCFIKKSDADSETLESTDVKKPGSMLKKKKVRRKTSMAEFEGITANFADELKAASEQAAKASKQQNMMKLVIEALIGARSDEKPKYFGNRSKSYTSGEAPNARARWQKGGLLAANKRSVENAKARLHELGFDEDSVSALGMPSTTEEETTIESSPAAPNMPDPTIRSPRTQIPPLANPPTAAE